MYYSLSNGNLINIHFFIKYGKLDEKRQNRKAKLYQQQLLERVETTLGVKVLKRLFGVEIIFKFLVMFLFLFHPFSDFFISKHHMHP